MYGVPNRSSFGQCSSRFNKTDLFSKHHLSIPNELPTKQTRVALVEMSRRVDDLNIRQDQTLDLALISFIWPFFNKEGQAG